MASNEFKLFAGPSTNTYTPAAWAALTTLLANGFSSGTASTQQVNTLMRQLSTAVAGLAQFIANQNVNALDNGDINAFATSLSNALKAYIGLSEVGKISYVPATVANPDHLTLFGAEVSRTAYPVLWAFAQASGMLVTDADFATRPGCFSYGSGGSGGSTFRLPKLSGLVIKAYHNNDGTYTTDTTSLLGQYIPDQLLSHKHLFYASETSDYTYTGPDDERNSGYRQQAYDTSYTGGAENMVRSVILLPQIRYR